MSPNCRRRVEATIVATKSLRERPDVEVVKVTDLRRVEPQPAAPDPVIAEVVEEPFVEKVDVVEKLVEEADTESIVVEVENASRILFSEGKKLAIKGSDSVIVVSGGCSELVLTGKRNQIQVDFAEHIKIEGDVNTFVVGTFGRGQIDGNGNVVSWGEGMNGNVPIALSNGEGNEIGRLE
ncbi:MAG: DUF3060 domain-containing protein [Verrucomicrobiales bacterium]|nr:DUF3060 domain-containing protein [Verrucomicrobiales bacterium]